MNSQINYETQSPSTTYTIVEDSQVVYLDHALLSNIQEILPVARSLNPRSNLRLNRNADFESIPFHLFFENGNLSKPKFVEAIDNEKHTLWVGMDQKKFFEKYSKPVRIENVVSFYLQEGTRRAVAVLNLDHPVCLNTSADQEAVSDLPQRQQPNTQSNIYERFVHSIEELPRLNDLLKPSIEDSLNKMILDLEEGVSSLAYTLAMPAASSGNCKRLTIKMDESLEQMVNSIQTQNLTEDGLEVNFKQTFQKKFEDLFNDYLRRNRYFKNTGTKPQKIKWNQLNTYLQGDMNIGTPNHKLFYRILIEFIEECRLKAFDYRDCSLNFISKLKLLSLKRAVSVIRSSMTDENEFKYLQFLDSWPTVKVDIYFE